MHGMCMHACMHGAPRWGSGFGVCSGGFGLFSWLFSWLLPLCTLHRAGCRPTTLLTRQARTHTCPTVQY